MNSQDYLQAGIAAVWRDENLTAERLFAKAITLDPRSEAAWLWLGLIENNPARRDYCFRRVLALNPKNPEALTRLGAINTPRSLARPAAHSPRAAPHLRARPHFLLHSLAFTATIVLTFLLVRWIDVNRSVQGVAISQQPLATLTRNAPVARIAVSVASVPTNVPEIILSQLQPVRASNSYFAQIEKLLDEQPQAIAPLLLPRLNQFGDKDELAEAYAFLGRAELKLQHYRAAAGYFKQLCMLDPSVECLFMLAVANDLAGERDAALENYRTLAGWSGKDALLYRALAERRVKELGTGVAAPPNGQ